jgi:hypothetical protein
VLGVGFEYSENLRFIFEAGGDLESVGRILTEEEAYIMKARYLAEQYHSYPWEWDSFYPCEKWCAEDINTIVQCDIAYNNREKRKKNE